MGDGVARILRRCRHKDVDMNSLFFEGQLSAYSVKVLGNDKI